MVALPFSSLMKQKSEVYEPMLPELKYSSEWKKEKHVAVDTEMDVLANDTKDDDEPAPVVALVATSSTSARTLRTSQVRLI
ncbi:hypothetical protein PVK06_033420 [Gossypium arboreum]|uniref:Uncharacterized protein n=1 Tax=Gossypium arboreum TaxID=29729 RepID=A0ABR0NCC4_GOSAR|nr:hypothetical protein PVK06_033420 [Gossypium arboreum]